MNDYDSAESFVILTVLYDLDLFLISSIINTMLPSINNTTININTLPPLIPAVHVVAWKSEQK